MYKVWGEVYYHCIKSEILPLILFRCINKTASSAVLAPASNQPLIMVSVDVVVPNNYVSPISQDIKLHIIVDVKHHVCLLALDEA